MLWAERIHALIQAITTFVGLCIVHHIVQYRGVVLESAGPKRTGIAAPRNT